ncbi:hypothetical protein EYZ11_006282 [Aspergillus tanneri]|uniref:Uncharacterized protein n=1 Tax=Aspergillus tanneri TaxID=1220188 RepID=A0A4S3JLP9_9EURO|nr:hypothetical protein EYZ11_006282 [Aspergillus tanneri]
MRESGAKLGPDPTLPSVKPDHKINLFVGSIPWIYPPGIASPPDANKK